MGVAGATVLYVVTSLAVMVNGAGVRLAPPAAVDTLTGNT